MIRRSASTVRYSAAWASQLSGMSRDAHPSPCNKKG